MYFYGKSRQLSSFFVAQLIVFTSQHYMQSALRRAYDRDIKRSAYSTYVQKKFRECGIANDITAQKSMLNQIPLPLLVHIAEFVGNIWHPTKAATVKSKLYSLSMCTDGNLAVIDNSGMIRILSSSTLDTVQIWKRNKKLSALTSMQGVVVLGGTDGSIDLWNVHTDAVTHVQAGGLGPISSFVELSPHILVAGTFPGIIPIFNLKTCVCTKMLRTERWCYTTTVIYPNKIAAGSEDTIQIFDTLTGRCLAMLPGHIYTVRTLTTASDTLVSGSYDKTIKLWDINTEKCTRTLQGHQSGVYALVSPNKNTLISGDHYGNIKFWDIPSGKCTTALTGNRSTVRSLVTLGNNKFASCYYDGAIKIWEKDLMDCGFTGNTLSFNTSSSSSSSSTSSSRSTHKRKFYETSRPNNA